MSMDKWVGFHFSTGVEAGADYKQFQKEARSELKKQVAKYGFNLYQFNGNHYEFSAVLQQKDTGEFIYVAISDVRFWPDEWYRAVLVRTMAHEKDWTGGPNYRCHWNNIGSCAANLAGNGMQGG